MKTMTRFALGAAFLAAVSFQHAEASGVTSKLQVIVSGKDHHRILDYRFEIWVFLDFRAWSRIPTAKEVAKHSRRHFILCGLALRAQPEHPCAYSITLSNRFDPLWFHDHVPECLCLILLFFLLFPSTAPKRSSSTRGL